MKKVLLYYLDLEHIFLVMKFLIQSNIYQFMVFFNETLETQDFEMSHFQYSNEPDLQFGLRK